MEKKRFSIKDILPLSGMSMGKNANSIYLILQGEKDSFVKFILWNKSKENLQIITDGINNNKPSIIREIQKFIDSGKLTVDSDVEQSSLGKITSSSPLYSSIILPILKEDSNLSNLNIFQEIDLSGYDYKALIDALSKFNLFYQEFIENIKEDINHISSLKSMGLLATLCQEDKKSIVDILLEHPKIDVNLLTRCYKGGATPLMICALYNRIDCAKSLLKDARLDINKQNSDGKTALALACQYGRLPMVELILKQGSVDLSLTDSDNKTVLDLVTDLMMKGGTNALLFEKIRELLKNVEKLTKKSELSCPSPDCTIDYSPIEYVIKDFNVNLKTLDYYSTIKDKDAQKFIEVIAYFSQLKTNPALITEVVEHKQFSMLFNSLVKESISEYQLLLNKTSKVISITRNIAKIYIRDLVFSALFNQKELLKDLLKSGRIKNATYETFEGIDISKGLFDIFTEEEKEFIKDKRCGILIKNKTIKKTSILEEFINLRMETGFSQDEFKFLLSYLDSGSYDSFLIKFIESLKEDELLKILVEKIAQTSELKSNVFNYDKIILLKNKNPQFLDTLLTYFVENLPDEVITKKVCYSLAESSEGLKILITSLANLSSYAIGNFFFKFTNYFLSDSLFKEDLLSLFESLSTVSQDSQLNEKIINNLLVGIITKGIHLKQNDLSNLLFYLTKDKIISLLDKTNTAYYFKQFISRLKNIFNITKEELSLLLFDKILDSADYTGLVEDLERKEIETLIGIEKEGDLQNSILYFSKNYAEPYDAFKLLSVLKSYKLVPTDHVLKTLKFYLDWLSSLVESSQNISGMNLVYSSIFSDVVAQQSKELDIFAMLEKELVKKNDFKQVVEPALNELQLYISKYNKKEGWLSKLFKTEEEEENKVIKTGDQMYQDLAILIEKKKVELSKFDGILKESNKQLAELQDVIHPFVEIAKSFNKKLSKNSTYEEIKLPQNIIIFEENVQFAITKNNILLTTLKTVTQQLDYTKDTLQKEIPIFMMTKEVNSLLDGLTQLSSNL